MKYDDGSIYEGEFFWGKKHGKGKLTFADGTRQDGYFHCDEFKGT